MEYIYRPTGVCAKSITFEIEEDIVTDVRFEGGCSGNAGGMAALAKGQNVEELVAKLEGIRCGKKATSCPDQLAKALKDTIAAEAEQSA